MIYSKERAFKAAKATVILKSSAQLLGILVTVLLVKLLTEEEYGVYQTLFATIAVIGSILSLGIGNTLQRYIPKYLKQADYSLSQKIINIAFWARLFSLLLLCTIGYIFQETIINSLYLSEHLNLVPVFLGIVLLHFQSRLLSTVLSACLMQGINQLAQITLVSVKIILYCYFYMNDFRLMSVFVADLVAYSLMLTVLAYGYWRYIRSLKGGRSTFEKAEKTQIIKYAAFNNLNDVGVMSLGRDIDVLFVASMVDVMSAGAYAFANRVGHILRQVSPVSYFIDVIRPMFFTLEPVKDKEKVSLYFNLLFKMNYLFELPMICGLYLFYPFIIEYLFEGKYAQYQLLTTFVFVIVCASSFGIYVGLIAQLKERADIVFYSKFFAVMNILGNLVLIPVLGVYGAVISTLISIIAKDVFVFYFVKDSINIRASLTFLILSIFYWLCVACIGEALASYLGYELLSFVVQFFFCLVCYGLYIKLNIFNKSEKEFLLNTSKNKRHRLKVIGVSRD